MAVVVPAAPFIGAFSDYLDLRTAVVEFTGRQAVVEVFPRLTQLAEVMFNRDLKFRQRIRTSTLNFDAGTAPIPDDYWEAIGLFTTSGVEYIEQPTQATVHGGCYYSVGEADFLAPGLQGDMRLDYYSEIPTISDSMSSSNWLLRKCPDVYFYGVTLEAARFLKDLEMANAMLSLLGGALASAKSDDDQSRFSRARVRVAGCTP